MLSGRGGRRGSLRRQGKSWGGVHFVGRGVEGGTQDKGGGWMCPWGNPDRYWNMS